MTLQTDPAFATKPNNKSATLGTFDASFTAPTNVTTLITAATEGTEVRYVRAHYHSTGAPSNGVINLWIYDGSTYHLFDQFVVPTSPSGTTTGTAMWQDERFYPDLVLQSGQSLRASHTVTGNDNDITIHAFGADFQV